MRRYQNANTVEEQDLVRDLDSGIRLIRLRTQLPWTLKKTSLKVFQDVLEYPVASDHDDMAYIDNDKKYYGQRARFFYTSLQQFYEDVANDRNQLAEIWDNNTQYIGCRYTPPNAVSVLVNNAETVADFSVSGDATAVVLDQVTYKEGNGSMKVTITASANTATVTNSSTSRNDDETYKKKYYFRWIYLDTVPTSVTLRYGSSATAYFASAALTTQFSGQAMKADEWNLFAFDLNGATQTGTVDDTAFDYEAVVFASAGTGTYYIDASYVKTWDLLDYWYYSLYHVATVSSTPPNQEYFFNSSEVYSTDSKLTGPSEWADVIMYQALLLTYIDEENKEVRDEIKQLRDVAWSALFAQYPSHKPTIITLRHRFETEYLRLQ